MNRARSISTILIALTITGFLPVLVPVIGSPPTWSSPTLVDGSTSVDLLSSAYQSSNGTLWVAWQTNRYRGDSLYDIAYKTYTNGIGSTVKQFTSSGFNNAPSVTQLANGSIAMFWALKTSTPGSYQIFYKLYNLPTGWSSQRQATTTSLNDTNPSTAVDKTGTLWLTWTRNNNTCSGSCTDPWKHVYYKKLTGNVWSVETKMTTDTQQNFYSNVMLGKDGVVRITWSKGLGSLQNYQIYYKTYNNTVWSTETKIVTSTTSDEHPSLMQDRNGTLWLFWGRKISTGPQTFYYAVFGKYSYTGGTTWLAATEKQLTNTPTNVDSLVPFAVQSTYDKSIYVFYTTNPNNNDDIYMLISSPISPIHDVTIIGAYSSINLQYPGGMASVGQSPIVTLSITVFNKGDTSDIVTGTLKVYNTTVYNLGTRQGLPAPGGTATLSFTWNTTGVTPGWYNVNATVTLASGETPQNQYDNSYTGKHVLRIIPIADVDQNGKVDIVDLGVFFFDFGAIFGSPNYNPLCDIGNTGSIDITDIGIVTAQFGAQS